MAEWNQTSTMSFSLVKERLPHLAHDIPSGSSSTASRLYQASAPSVAKSSATWSMNSPLASTSPQSSQYSAGMGTPQSR